jgi:hypothetical protein
MGERLRSGRLGVLVAGGAVTVAAIVLFVAWATKDRTMLVAVPQPGPLTTVETIAIRPGQEVCLRGVTFVPDGEVALVRVGTVGKPGQPLTAIARAPGYSAEGSVSADWVDNQMLSFPLDPPDEAVRGTFCVRNDGRRTVHPYAAGDAHTPAETYVDGRRVEPNLQLAFAREGPTSFAERAGDIVAWVTLFRPGVVVPALIWVLLVLTLLALTAGVVWTMWRALGEPDGGRSGTLDADREDPGGARHLA